MDEIVSIIGAKNKYINDIRSVEEPIYIRILYLIIYVFSWITVIYISQTQNNHIPVGIGFFIGLFLIFIVDFINSSKTRYFVDRNVGALVRINMTDTYIGIDNEYYKFSHKDAIWLNKNTFKKLSDNKKINATPIKLWIDKQYNKFYGSVSVGNPNEILQNTKNVIQAGYHMIMSLITLGILSSSVSYKLSKQIFPFIIVGSIFAVAFPSLWIINSSAINLSSEHMIKIKSLIASISFSICASLLFLLHKY